MWTGAGRTSLALVALLTLALPLHGRAASVSIPSPATGGNQLIVRLINADTGHPMSHQNLLVAWDDDAEESIIYVGGKGVGTMQTMPGFENFTVKPGVKDWGDPNRLAYYSCSGPTVSVPVADAKRQGFVAHNECNGRTIAAAPGEIVFWARPLPLWKPDFQ